MSGTKAKLIDRLGKAMQLENAKDIQKDTFSFSKGDSSDIRTCAIEGECLKDHLDSEGLKDVFESTEEQEKIYATLRPPGEDDLKKKHIVRVTAGAGSGKTTTILQLAVRATNLGHTHITYVTFNKAAAEDGRRRVEKALKEHDDQNHNKRRSTPVIIEARTLHSCAMRLLSASRKNKYFEHEIDNVDGLLNEVQLDKLISDVCRDDIELFLQQAVINIKRKYVDVMKLERRIMKMKRQIVFFIRKTLWQFCNRSFTPDNFNDQSFCHRDYYPAKQYHKYRGRGEELGFPYRVYEQKISEYANMAFKVWQYIESKGIRTYDVEIKRAQLSCLQIPGTLLLVDECQDLDECQIDWIAKQEKYGTHIYLVGDAAQTIYSFRGAKSKYMMNIEVDEEKCLALTKSWRFGPGIASIANLVLFMKEFSPQTTENCSSPIWRLLGCDLDGEVIRNENAVSETLLHKWNEKPITIIAATNAELFLKAIELFGIDINTNDNSDVNEAQEDSSRLFDTEDIYDITKDLAGSKVEIDESSYPQLVHSKDLHNRTARKGIIEPNGNKRHDNKGHISFPKIHIHGKGESSGLKKWKKIIVQISYVFRIFMSENEGLFLPKNNFPEFSDEKITWNEFLKEVENRDLGKYRAAIDVVSICKYQTMNAIDIFEREVVVKSYDIGEAQVILSTVHAAKGMEWDNVYVCPDIFHRNFDPSKLIFKKNKWQFQLKSWGDELNLLYVACTRAKKTLSIPYPLSNILDTFDTLHHVFLAKELYKPSDNISDMDEKNQLNLFCINLSKKDIIEIFKTLVLKLRFENRLSPFQKLSTSLICDMQNEVCYDFPDKYKHSEEYLEFITSNKTKSEQSIFELMNATNDVAPTIIERPYDRKEVLASTGKSTCRSCRRIIKQGEPRIGNQVYQPERKEYWLYWFHDCDECFPMKYRKNLNIRCSPKRNDTDSDCTRKLLRKQGRFN